MTAKVTDQGILMAEGGTTTVEAGTTTAEVETAMVEVGIATVEVETTIVVVGTTMVEVGIAMVEVETITAEVGTTGGEITQVQETAMGKGRGEETTITSRPEGTEGVTAECTRQGTITVAGTILAAETVTTLGTGSRGTTGSHTAAVVSQTASTSVRTTRATSNVVSTRIGGMRVGIQLGHTAVLLAGRGKDPTPPMQGGRHEGISTPRRSTAPVAGLHCRLAGAHPCMRRAGPNSLTTAPRAEWRVSSTALRLQGGGTPAVAMTTMSSLKIPHM